VYRGDELLSTATDRRGNPHLTLRRKAGESELCVSSMEQLDQILKLAGTKKVSETRICLEGILQLTGYFCLTLWLRMVSFAKR